MLTRQQKIEQANQLAAELKTQDAWYFVGFSGITFPQLNELRKLLREKNATMRIIKTRVLGKALESIGKTIPAETEGKPVAILTMEDYLTTAKVLTTFAKDHPNLTIYGGYVEGENVDSARESPVF
ncbi:50S ribosomal protein L10 [Candidatus Berkelbacteria bacterium]|nr:50S ribosomal protein L10 [Candidatus Berkelbacteria bacterium]